MNHRVVESKSTFLESSALVHRFGSMSTDDVWHVHTWCGTELSSEYTKSVLIPSPHKRLCTKCFQSGDRIAIMEVIVV